MQIIYIGSEMEPYCKVGGLGDVMGALPERLAQKKVDVKVIIPYYGTIEEEKYNIISDIDSFTINIGQEQYKTKIHRIQQSNYDIYLIGNDEYFARKGIYTNESGEAYEDNFLRFLYFQRAALKFIENAGFQPDLIHCHDNQAALVPVYLKQQYVEHPQFHNTKTILTLHNIGYQGNTGFHNKKYMDLPAELFEPCAMLEWYGQINPLKGGIIAADKVTTVSQGHAREITENERLSGGLKPVIQSRKDEVVGIVNGIDENYWNPETDEFIDENYSLADFTGKKQNKIKLLEEVNFATDNLNIPLIGIVSRLVEQKGIELILEKMEELLANNIKLIILGSGVEQFQLKLKALAARFSNRLNVSFSYNVPFSHRIIAGSDMLLMPSRYEPCGITQMMAMEYGTIPIAHRTGGLEDTISHGKTGFLFDEYSGSAMLKAVNDAFHTYHNPAQWEDLMINAMNSDFSWDRSVDAYIKLYTRLLEE